MHTRHEPNLVPCTKDLVVQIIVFADIFFKSLVLICISFQYTFVLLSSALPCRYFLRRYSFVLTLNTRPWWPHFPNTRLFCFLTLICVDTSSIDTRLYWLSTLVCVGTIFVSTRLYWLLTLILVVHALFSALSYRCPILISVDIPFLVLVHIDF